MKEQIEIQSTDQRPAIKLQFVRSEDRWEHRLILATEDSDAVIMTSVEGTPDQNLPPSAPLQDASRQTLEHGDAILCVGMAAKNHWSASFSVEFQGQAGVIKSDLACLQKTIAPDARLGSTYTLDSLCQVESFSEYRVEIRLDDRNGIVLEPLSDDGPESIFKLNDQTLWIKPSRISVSPVVATRWGFSIGNL